MNASCTRTGVLEQICIHIALAAVFTAVTPGQVTKPLPVPGPEQDYLVYLVAESADKIYIVRFGPKGAHVESDVRTGLMPTDINGPHGIVISPDRQFFYVAQGHGRPSGSVWKYRTATNELIKYTSLGLFPATTDITRDGNFIYVANANFHGDMVPSSISVVATDQMIEVKRITTCTMPHGSRFNPQGTKHYSVCMMDDMLVEIDPAKFAVSRYFVLSKGREMGMQGAPPAHAGGHPDRSCVPTWAQPSNDGSSVYVACNQSSEIVEVSTNDWKMVKRYPAGPGAYNLAVTRDGRLIATNKRGQSVSIFDPGKGIELARIPTKRKVVHGAVVSPDDRYVFITVEGVGADPGRVEVIDLRQLKTVATVDVGEQAAGIDFWKTEPSK
jgi:DNA-binding beta-propeller fold protein YncE